LIATSSCVVSVASIWEVAIKHRVGKLPIPPQVFRDEIQYTGAALLAIADVHAIATTEVPLGHKDPFDRLLLATAQTEHLVAADRGRRAAEAGSAGTNIAPETGSVSALNAGYSTNRSPASAIRNTDREGRLEAW
jgi:PIN domain nuclease of toxin-antitoxin system